jgi:hypothetical protein
VTLTGPQLGALWEQAVAAQIERSNALRALRGLPQVEAQWTQPEYRRIGGRWAPAGRGAPDLTVWAPGRAVTVDCKAAMVSGPRWTVDRKLRLDMGGHQILRLRHRARLGHPAGVLLGAYPAGGAWVRPSAVYLIGALDLPWTAPSLLWAQLEAWRIAPDCDWWEALGAPTQMEEE